MLSLFANFRSKAGVNWEGCGRKGSQWKILFFLLRVTLVCVAAASQLAVTVRGESRKVNSNQSAAIKKSRICKFFFWYRLSWVVMEKGQ